MQTGYPKAQIGVLLGLVGVVSFSFECIFPFVNSFLLEIGVVKDPADAGFYSGIVESVFSISQLATVFPATWASNVYGRKPVALIGAVGVAFSMVLFGTSKSYWRMIASRSLGGLVGGSDTAIRVMASELSSKESEGHVFTMIVIAYRIGQIMGQPVGGLLSHPERNFPKLFDTPFWREYPFSLPCFVGAVYALICAILGQIILKETLQPKRPRKATTSSESGEATPLLIDRTASPGSDGKKDTSHSISSVLTWPLLSLLISNSSMVLITEILFAVYPLFAFTPIRLGGLGLSEAKIGLHMSMRSLLHVFSMFPYSRLEKRFGRMAMFRFSMIAWLPTIVLFPVLNSLARQGKEDGALWYITLIALFTAWSATGWAWTSIFLLASGYSPHADAVATVQGLLSASIITPQAFAPAVGTTSFALSLRYPNMLGGKSFWMAVFSLSAVAATHTFTLQDSAHDWRAERVDDVTEVEQEGI